MLPNANSDAVKTALRGLRNFRMTSPIAEGFFG